MTICAKKSDVTTERLLAYCAGRLSGPASAELERHLENCPDCAALRDAQLSVWTALEAWEAPPVSADFNRRLFARIDAAESAPWYRRWLDALQPAVARPAFPLSLAAVVMAVGFLLDHPAKPPVRSAAQVSATEAEQVETTLDDLEMLHQFDVNAEQNAEDREKTSKSM